MINVVERFYDNSISFMKYVCTYSINSKFVLVLEAARHSIHVCLAMKVEKPPAASFLGSDALAGGGVRAIRYALEAGGPVEVVANDHSMGACQGRCFRFCGTRCLPIAAFFPVSNKFWHGTAAAHTIAMAPSVKWTTNEQEQHGEQQRQHQQWELVSTAYFEALHGRCPFLPSFC